MTDDRSLERAARSWLEEGPTRAPDQPVGVALARIETTPQERAPWLPWLRARRAGGLEAPGFQPRTVALFAVLSLLLLSIVVGLLGAGLHREPARAPDVLDDVLALGRIRIAVRPDHPQFEVGSRPAVGFDGDVAEAIAQHMGVRAEVVIVDVSTVLAGPSDAWDAALPSVGAWAVDQSLFNVSRPYYAWPHRLVVGTDSQAGSIGDVAGGTICAVAGDAGETWLRGGPGLTPAAPPISSVVTAPTDDECLSLLASGDADAVITARLSDADLQLRTGIRVIEGPAPEDRGAIVAARPTGDRTATGLLGAINAALSAMQADGTLTRLSQNRFGGADLTPKP